MIQNSILQKIMINKGLCVHIYYVKALILVNFIVFFLTYDAAQGLTK